MFYAVLDREYEKQETDDQTVKKFKGGPKPKYFMSNPELYKIGLNKECLSYPIFAYWVAYGMA